MKRRKKYREVGVKVWVGVENYIVLWAVVIILTWSLLFQDQSQGYRIMKV